MPARKPTRATRAKGKPLAGPVQTSDQGSQAERSRALADERARVIARQRADCRRLARSLRGLSASTPNEAAQLSRATQTLHELEGRAYGLHGSSRGVQAVIVVPGVLGMDAWTRAAARALGAAAGVGAGADQGSRRRLEDDVQGSPADDVPDAGGGE